MKGYLRVLLISSFMPMYAFSDVHVDENVYKKYSKKDGYDVLVEVTKTNIEKSDNSLSSLKKAFKNKKKDVLSNVESGDFELLSDYENLPVVHVKLKDKSALDKLVNSGGIVGIYDNASYTMNLSQSLPAIKQPVVASYGHGGYGTSVVVIDTGVNYKHSAFGSCTSPGVPAGCRVAVSLDIAPEDNALDAHGHGTNVSAIVAAVANKSKIIALDVFEGSNASAASILSAIDWSINHKQEYNIVAMNMSLGSSSSLWSTECVNSWASTSFNLALDAGIIPVVAAGNNGSSTLISEPACAPGAVRVGAVDDALKVASFSNSNPLLTIMAPGVNITAAGITMSGTSQATPHVAGAIAVLRSNDTYGDEPVELIRNRLVNSNTIITNTKNSVKKPLLNLDMAVSHENFSLTGHGTENNVYVEKKGWSIKPLWGESYYANVKATADQYCNLLGYHIALSYAANDCGDDESSFAAFNPTSRAWVTRDSGSSNRCYALISDVQCGLR